MVNHRSRRQVAYLSNLLTKKQSAQGKWVLLLSLFPEREVLLNRGGVVPSDGDWIQDRWSPYPSKLCTRYYRIKWDHCHRMIVHLLLWENKSSFSPGSMYPGYELLGEPFRRIKPDGFTWFTFDSWNDIPGFIRPYGDM